MPFKRLTLGLAFASLWLCAAGHAQTAPVAPTPAPIALAPLLLDQLPIFNPAPMLARSTLPNGLIALAHGDDGTTADDGDQAAEDEGTGSKITDLRKALLALAMKLRDTRYVRGGSNPSTGFDCSGFVRYVFAHAVGVQLPANSAAQFLDGLKVRRADMEPGDLVFFHTRGRHRVSHVGIYISEGRFIHSPTTGKSVQISSLDDAYWAKHFIGAKRPDGLAMSGHSG